MHINFKSLHHHFHIAEAVARLSSVKNILKSFTKFMKKYLNRFLGEFAAKYLQVY